MAPALPRQIPHHLRGQRGDRAAAVLGLDEGGAGGADGLFYGFFEGCGRSLYVGGGIMVVALAKPHEKLRAQGVNDMIISSFSAVAALTSGSFLVIFGWPGLQIFALMVLVPLVVFGVIVRFGGVPSSTGQAAA